MNSTKTKCITVFGAGGETGDRIVRQAVERGWTVRAVEHHWPEGATPMPGVEPVEADVLSDDLRPAVEGADAVLSALGIGLSLRSVIDPPPLYTESAVRIVRAMQAASVRRLVVVSASFVETRARGPLWFRGTAMVMLDRMYRQMGDMERVLRSADGIDWTAVRPGWLMDGDLTDDYVVCEDAIPEGLIRTRHADLAHFMLELVETGDWIGRTPAIAREEDPSRSSPLEILRELTG